MNRRSNFRLRCQYARDPLHVTYLTQIVLNVLDKREDGEEGEVEEVEGRYTRKLAIIYGVSGSLGNWIIAAIGSVSLKPAGGRKIEGVDSL